MDQGIEVRVFGARLAKKRLVAKLQTIKIAGVSVPRGAASNQPQVERPVTSLASGPRTMAKRGQEGRDAAAGQRIVTSRPKLGVVTEL